jgi:hypothetical protein
MNTSRTFWGVMVLLFLTNIGGTDFSPYSYSRGVGSEDGHSLPLRQRR